LGSLVTKWLDHQGKEQDHDNKKSKQIFMDIRSFSVQLGMAGGVERPVDNSFFHIPIRFDGNIISKASVCKPPGR
jgi:hypothetical protein